MEKDNKIALTYSIATLLLHLSEQNVVYYKNQDNG